MRFLCQQDPQKSKYDKDEKSELKEIVYQELLNFSVE
jgi:hypothetical protein